MKFDHFQGAQGETGTKGERGEPGLPVSQYVYLKKKNLLKIDISLQRYNIIIPKKNPTSTNIAVFKSFALWKQTFISKKKKTFKSQ